MATAWLNPNGDYSGSDGDYTNVDDGVEPPSETGFDGNVDSLTSANLGAEYEFETLDAVSVSQIVVYVHCEDTSSPYNMDCTIYLDGGYETAQGKDVTPDDWLSYTFSGSWSTLADLRAQLDYTGTGGVDYEEVIVEATYTPAVSLSGITAGTAIIDGSALVLSYLLGATSAGAASLSGTMVQTLSVSGSADGGATASAFLAQTRPISGIVSATGVFASNRLQSATFLYGTVDGAATVTGARPGVTYTLSGVAAGAATASGNIVQFWWPEFDLPQGTEDIRRLYWDTTGTVYVTLDGIQYWTGSDSYLDLDADEEVRQYLEVLDAMPLTTHSPNDRVELSWAAVSGADYYEVERSDDDGSTWTEIAEVEDTSYTDGPLEDGTYKYRVAANTRAGTLETDSNVETVTVSSAPEPPTALSATVG